MSEADAGKRSGWSRRLWVGAFGAFIGAMLGMATAAAIDRSLGVGVLWGAGIGFVVGFLVGRDGVEALMQFWTG